MNNDERKTPSGIPLKAYYTGQDFAKTTAAIKDDLPGQGDFTRGIFSTGFRQAPWMESLACGYSLPEETNKRAKYLASVGQQGFEGRASINLVFDRPTFCGLDSDHPMATAEVGNIGVIIDSVHDMERLFKDFDLDMLNVGFIVDRSGPFIMAMYLALADKLGFDRKKLRGIVTNNPLTDMFCSKTPMFPADACMKLMIDTFKFCSVETPLFNLCRINGYNTRESGSDAIQEVGFNLAIARAIVSAGVEAGISATDMAMRINFQFSQGVHFFEDVCKIRAARRMWSTMLREEFDVTDEKARRLKIHMQTAGSSLTAQEPENNIARIALHTAQSAIAGTQSIHIASYDEALGIPTEESVRIAIKTSKLIMEEVGLADVVDPLGGSYYVESLTDEIEQRVLKVMEEVEAVGGVIKALNGGYFEQEIANTAYLARKEFDAGERVVVGVNKYREEESAGFGKVVFRPDNEVSKLAIERVRKLRSERDQSKAQQAIESIREALRNNQPVMPRYIDAAKADVTLGEMVSAVEEIVGSYKYAPITANVS